MCFVLVWLYNLFVDSCDLFTHILQDCFTGTGAILTSAPGASEAVLNDMGTIDWIEYYIRAFHVTANWFTLSWWLQMPCHQFSSQAFCNHHNDSNVIANIIWIILCSIWYNIILSVCLSVSTSILHPVFDHTLKFPHISCQSAHQIDLKFGGCTCYGTPQALAWWAAYFQQTVYQIYFKLNTNIHDGCSQAWLTFGHILLNL